jgi:tetratricopeptide (TPR) repeat protein
VNECSSALEAAPAYHKALVRRAKAYEQMGHYKQALSDIQKANKAETANPDTQVRTPRALAASKARARPRDVFSVHLSSCT